ncbi:MAG: EAL domain-containing protein [Chloroflexota bacterium]|nr:EAL domain-containing protein [Chloroflexota bacterium]
MIHEDLVARELGATMQGLHTYRPGTDRVVELARQQLGMDVAFLSEWRDGQQVFRSLDGTADSFGLRRDEASPLPDSYCQRVVDGRMPNTIPDTGAERAVQNLPATTERGIGAYIGVPVLLSDGSQYGMLCGMSHASEPTLNQRDVRFLSVLASLVADEVEAATAVDERQQALHERITEVIREASFEVVFQPIIALRSERAAGYEALSRFSAQPTQPPDAWFTDAAAAGLQVELELATATAAVRQLSKLPPATFMAINCSPATISHPRLRRLLATVDRRRIVLELTEHTQIDDYAALRDSVGLLRRKGVRLAIDDAGAGYSSLRHIVQLAPDLIKVDIGLVRSIHQDPARRALVSSLAQFARETNAQLVAEGIEEQAELETLLSLRVTFGQGYLLGRPSPLLGARDQARARKITPVPFIKRRGAESRAI